MSLEAFFKDRNAVLLVDSLAKRYGKTPYEIVANQTVYQFNFNTAVMYGAMEIEAQINKEVASESGSGGNKKQKEQPTLQEFGIKRTIQKKVKE